MKKILLLASALLICFWVSAQSEKNYGKVVNFNLNNFKTNSLQAVSNRGLVSKLSVDFPLYNGLTAPFVFDETLVSAEKINGIQTFDAVSKDGQTKMKLTITSSGMSGIMHTPEGYLFIEPVNIKNNEYRIYKSSDVKNASITCDQHETPVEININKNKNKRMLSVAPFPVGTQLRTYKLAAAATGEMTALYGSQDAALAQIVAIANANNLIYELEASIRFELVIQTTNKSIVFTNAATDPFDAPISVEFGQAGFITMNTNGTLPYTAYGIGHTFNTLPSPGPNSFGGNGVAGPTPCVDDSKSRGFTQWTLGSPLSLIINIFTHEVAHQFASFHTYNAIGGSPTTGATFCLDGWGATSAIEPGSGTTMMSYANNCTNPTNYVISGNNQLQYFNAKSLEQIFTTINTAPTNSCITSTATGNTAPVANAGVAITIPKGTPFTINGSATDANGDPMTYTWEQYDLASENDKGALGSAINGIGGYPAVNSPTAPLFRSEQSSSTSRTFPKMAYILNNANNPADNEGEDLPQVARNMNFRFTVRDNKAGGGGVDSDQITVTVNNTGPLEVSAFNTAQTVAAGSSQTITWNVNNTNTLAANVKILFSVDEGKTFPFTLLSSTPNNGSATVTIPANIVDGVNQGRIKISAEINPNAEFFDLNNANITITSSCLAKATIICSETSVSGTAGSTPLNLGLSFVTGSGVPSFGKTFPTTGLTTYPLIEHQTNTSTGCQVSTFASTSPAILVPFRVTKQGSYTLSRSSTGGGAVVFSIFTSNTTFDCSTFVASSSEAGLSNYPSKSIALNECTTYYMLLYVVTAGIPSTTPTSATFNIQSQGIGGVIDIQPNQAGFNYTYVAVNQANSQITAVNATADFRTLSAGTYLVQGLSYISTFDPATLVNQTIAQAIASSSCILFSSNTKAVTVTGGTTVLPPTASAQARCTGQTVATLVATGTAIQWYAAMTGGTALATTTVLAAGTYYASQTVGGEESTRTAVAITVNALTTPSVSISPTAVCAGVTQIITTIPTNGGTATYLWKRNNVNFATTQNISITTAVAGDVYSLVMTPSADVCPNPTTPTATASLTIGAACVATITSVASGNWETAATWDLNRVPTVADVVVIAASHNVTVTTNDANAKKVETRSNGKITFSNNTTKLKLGF